MITTKTLLVMVAMTMTSMTVHHGFGENCDCRFDDLACECVENLPVVLSSLQSSTDCRTLPPALTDPAVLIFIFEDYTLQYCEVEPTPEDAKPLIPDSPAEALAGRMENVLTDTTPVIMLIIILLCNCEILL